MKTKLFSLLFALFSLSFSLFAQEEEAPKLGWDRGAGIGLDFAQLLQINPKQGAGQNRIGFGSATTYFANYTGQRNSWENQAAWQFGMQRLGSGVIVQGTDNIQVPFQKSLDELRISSKYGQSIKEGSKLYFAGLFNFLSQVTPTYQGNEAFPGNFISDVFDEGNLLSKFFSPATLQFSVGMDYKPNDKLSLYYSPIGTKFIIVGNDQIAALGVHGNPVERNEAGLVTSFENVDSQFGSTLKAGFADSFKDGKITFTSNLLLFSNYLNKPQNIDVDWNNALGYELFENFQLQLLLNVFYDDDMLMQITDLDAPGGVNGLGKRVSLTQQILLTYAKTF